ncbi:MAG: AMP-binding protein [Oscillospiraceae bacterium]|jgi:acyl-CoA synthetase
MQGRKIDPETEKKYRALGYWSDDTLLDRWERTVSAFGGKEFVCDDLGRHYSYAEIDRMAAAFAAHIEAAGIRQGDVVSFQITPRYEFLVVLFGCLKLGAVPAPLGLCFVDHELRELLVKIGSRLHVSVSLYRGSDRTAEMRSIARQLPQLCELIFVGGSIGGNGYTGLDFDEIIESAGVPLHRSRAKSNDIALILCTSGTTKGSKAVLFTHNSIVFSEETFNKAYELTAEDVIFMPAPLNHATGLHHGIISPMLRGGRLVLQERFSCREAVKIMNREGCTYSMGATPFVYDIIKSLEETGASLPKLRFYISGGAPVPAELVKTAWEKHGILICECYGSTESVPHVGVRPSECLENMGRWSGRAMDGIEVRVVDKERRPVPPGIIGEEASRGPNMFSGYIGPPELTDEALDADGWFYSGDLCVADESGNIKIVGRIKDIIVRGGENLNTNDISDNLTGCPGVLDQAVIGMPDERLGERICAFVVPAPGANVTKESIIAYLRTKRVQKRLWPERVELIDAIPRTDSGKVKKNVLSDILAERMKVETC